MIDSCFIVIYPADQRLCIKMYKLGESIGVVVLISLVWSVEQPTKKVITTRTKWPRDPMIGRTSVKI